MLDTLSVQNVGSNILDTPNVQNIGLTLNIDFGAKVPTRVLFSILNLTIFVLTLFMTVS